MSNFSSPDRQSHVAKNVQVNASTVQSVRFVRKQQADGHAFTWIKTRGLPKLVIRQIAAHKFVGHLPGQRDDVKAEASSERAVFAKLVEEVWTGKKAKKAAWHPEPVKGAKAVAETAKAKKAAPAKKAGKATVKTTTAKPSFQMPKSKGKNAVADKKSVATIVEEIDDEGDI